MFVVANESSLVLDGGRTRTLHYRLERARGYEYEGEVWSPGYFRVDLSEGEEAVLVGSTEDWDTVLAVNPDAIFASERQRRERLLSDWRSAGTKRPSRRINSPSNHTSPPPHSGRWISTMSQ